MDEGKSCTTTLRTYCTTICIHISVYNYTYIQGGDAGGVAYPRFPKRILGESPENGERVIAFMATPSVGL